VSKIKKKFKELLAFFPKEYDRAYSIFQGIFIDDEMDFHQVKQHEKLIKALFFLTILAVGIGISAMLVNTFAFIFFPPDSGRELGPFGDFFGGIVNPIFTFLTFFGLIITIVIQRMELRLARTEYKETSHALNTQAMETTFFNLLDLHHKIVDGLKFNPNILPALPEEVYLRRQMTPEKIERQTKFGRNVFESIVREFTKERVNPNVIIIRYKNFNIKNNNIVGHYFRNLYHILKVVDGYPDLSHDEKRKFASIVRAQLSSNELLLLFINCCEGVVDQGQFRNLLIKYHILEHIPLVYRDGNYYAPDISAPFANKEHVEQYFEEKLIIESAFEGNKGAFGKNENIKIS